MLTYDAFELILVKMNCDRSKIFFFDKIHLLTAQYKIPLHLMTRKNYVYIPHFWLAERRNNKGEYSINK